MFDREKTSDLPAWRWVSSISEMMGKYSSLYGTCRRRCRRCCRPSPSSMLSSRSSLRTLSSVSMSRVYVVVAVAEPESSFPIWKSSSIFGCVAVRPVTSSPHSPGISSENPPQLFLPPSHSEYSEEFKPQISCHCLMQFLKSNAFK